MVSRFVDFTKSIASIAKDILRIKTAFMEQYGLRGSSVNCFFYLSREKEGLTLTELSNLCGEDKAATSRIVNELIEKGYLVQNDSPKGSKYRAILKLTEKGFAVAKSVDGEINAVFKACGLEEENRDEFYQMINAIADSLHDYVEDLK